MNKESEWKGPLQKFAEASDLTKTFLALDLDGTALLEDHGKVFISSSVEKGVKAIHDFHIPVVLNTLRFPLSVMRTIGEAWYQIADVPILTVLLNGSVLGYIKGNDDGELHYEELSAFPLSHAELKTMLTGVRQLTEAGIDEILFFFYSRDWKEGETLWTPKEERVAALQKKFVSASRVFSGTVEQLAAELLRREICMTSLFIDRPGDTLMAYQHSKRNSFFTAKGVNKASGLREVAARIDRSCPAALGAGDTEMDTFLSEVGFAVIVGGAKLPFRGRTETLRVATPQELGDLILAYADFLKHKGAS
ncbi:MAG TPA: HAD hydrolase family protein [Methylomirabilota bacterium]|nr:HAD hydrolase family protein [Methylomirabilota bacterium]